MRKKLLTILKPAACLLTAAVMLCGCVKDETPYGPDPERDGFEMAFVTTVPAAGAGTRGLTGPQENTLHKVDILVFKNNGTEYAYRTYGTVDPEGTGNTSRIRAKVLPTGTTDKHSFVLMGNLRSEIEKADSDGLLTVGTAKQTVLDNITFNAYTSASGTTEIDRQWDVYTPRYLPMWGDNGKIYEINSSNDIETINSATDVIKMLRAVAKIEVVFDGTKTKNNFLWTQAYVYYANQGGNAVPLAANMETGGIKAKAPTIPGGTQKEMILYEIQDRNYDPAKRIYSLLNTIYVAEQKNKVNDLTPLPPTGRMGIIIGGIYDESGSEDFTTADETWYRLDFFYKEDPADPLEKQTMLDVLRNHRYQFKISRIDGHGYPDPGTAIESEPLNIENDILIWEDDLDLGDMKYDGFHYYSAAPLKFDHYLCRGNYKFHAYDSLVVKTNSPLYTHIELDYDASKFSTEPFVLNQEYDPVTGQTTAEVRFAVGDIPHDPAGIEHEYNIGLKFKDSPTGRERVSFRARLTQNSRKPDIDIDTLVWIMVNNDPAGLLFNDTKGYILADGDFSFVNIRLTEEIGHLGAIYMPKRVSATFMSGMNDWHDDNMTGTHHPSYDQFEHSMRIDLPVFGHNGFMYPHLPNSPWALMFPRWKVEYEQNTDKWVELPFSRPNWRMYQFILQSLSPAKPFYYPKEQGATWWFKFWGYFHEHPVMVAIKDGRHEGAQIVASHIIPAGDYPSSQIHGFDIWIDANPTPRDLYVFFSLTGREEDLVDALQPEFRTSFWEIYDGNRQY